MVVAIGVGDRRFKGVDDSGEVGYVRAFHDVRESGGPTSTT